MATASDEAKRRILVRLISCLYWLVIFEGVLRKWIFPQLGKELFFVRDPLVLFIYLYAWHNGLRLPKSLVLAFGLALASVAVPLAALQFAALGSGSNAPLALYGWRNYFLFFPVAFLIAEHFHQQDIERLIHRTLLLSIPIAVLVFLQFLSPAEAAINQGFGQTDDDTYSNPGLALGIVRTFGTFTSNLGQTIFVASCNAMLLMNWLTSKSKRSLKGVPLILATASTFVCLGLSGSRAAVVWTGILLLFTVLGSLLAGPKRMPIERLLLPFALFTASAAVFPLVFPTATQAFTTRWNGAADIEGGIFARATYDFFSFRLLFVGTPLQGYQLGGSGNAAGRLGESVATLTPEEVRAGESDWARHILELGTLIGPLYICFRLSLFALLFRSAAIACRFSGSPAPMILFGLPGVLLLNGLITGNGSVNGFAWPLIGLSMALNRTTGGTLHTRDLSVRKGIHSGKVANIRTIALGRSKYAFLTDTPVVPALSDGSNGS